MHGLSPQYLSDLIRPYSPTRCLRSENQLLLSQPGAKNKLFGHRMFSFAAPLEWNKLPFDIKNAKDITCFKSLLKTHLFKMHYGWLYNQLTFLELYRCFAYMLSYWIIILLYEISMDSHDIVLWYANVICHSFVEITYVYCILYCIYMYCKVYWTILDFRL